MRCGLQVLKEVLAAIGRVREQGPEMELRYNDLGERFRTRLHTAKPELCAEMAAEHATCLLLHAKWDVLGDEAAQVRLHRTHASVNLSLLAKICGCAAHVQADSDIGGSKRHRQRRSAVLAGYGSSTPCPKLIVT